MLEVAPVQDQRTAPPEVLAQLREIDPRADLILAAPGAWMLGVWNPSSEAMKRATRRLDRMMTMPVTEQNTMLAGRIALMQLAAKGFRPIEVYEQQEPDGRIVNDFRERDHNYRTMGDKAFEAAMDRSEIAPQAMDTIRDAIESQARSIHSKLRFGVSVFQGKARQLGSSARQLIRRI